MEGPLSPDDGYRGAHPHADVAMPTLDDFRRRQDAAAGRIVLVTLAPERPGALRLIEHLVDAGIRVALGHTAATAPQIADAINAGATLATHLGNGCPQLLPRHPNVIWDLLSADALAASIIADGHHLPPATVKSLIRAKGARRTILVTDAIAAAASPPGRYSVAGVECDLDDDGRVSLPGTPYLAGSSLTMDRAIGNAVRFTGLPLDDVVPMASTIPAAYLGARPLAPSPRLGRHRGVLRICEIKPLRSRCSIGRSSSAISSPSPPSASSSAIASATAESTFSAIESSARG
jgi:N-acetylglucosamine-6-phosphate deacetylase